MVKRNCTKKSKVYNSFAQDCRPFQFWPNLKTLWVNNEITYDRLVNWLSGKIKFKSSQHFAKVVQIIKVATCEKLIIFVLITLWSVRGKDSHWKTLHLHPWYLYRMFIAPFKVSFYPFGKVSCFQIVTSPKKKKTGYVWNEK